MNFLIDAATLLNKIQNPFMNLKKKPTTLKTGTRREFLELVGDLYETSAKSYSVGKDWMPPPKIRSKARMPTLNTLELEVLANITKQEKT